MTRHHHQFYMPIRIAIMHQKVYESLKGIERETYIRWVQIDMCQLLDQSLSQLYSALSDGNWFDFKDGKWYANSDLNKAPDIIRFFNNENVSFSRSVRNRFPFFRTLCFGQHSQVELCFNDMNLLLISAFRCRTLFIDNPNSKQIPILNVYLSPTWAT
jgi:hypothetical protein